MRILHVHDQATFQGGVEQILFDTARGLSGRGWPQGLLSRNPMPGNAFSQPFEVSSGDPSIIEDFRPDAVLLHKVSDVGWIEKLSQALPAAYMMHDHDLVCPRRHKYFPLGHGICNLPAGLACYTHLCWLQRSTNGSRLPLQIKGAGQVRQGMQAIRDVSHFLVGSAYMKRELEINGVGHGRISVVHPVPAALRVPGYHDMTGAPEVLFVGQVIRGKGVDLMLRALARVDGRWQARIVGDGNHLDHCKKLAEDLGLAERVHFTGWVDHDELAEYYASARMLVVPSRWPEPFGMVGIEAMSRGRPVVAFASGGIPDWLADGQTGLLVPSADVDAMTAAIQKLLNDKDLAQNLGQNAVEHVRRHFSHSIYLDQIMKQMENLT